jgi:hypothetical protein
VTAPTPDERAGLRAVAEAATPGPWRWEEPSKESWPQSDESLVSDGKTWESGGREYPETVLSGWGYDASGTEADAEDRAHIAAFDPPTVLALLDALDAAERKLAAVEAAFDPGELDCGRIGLPCTQIRPREGWCRPCRIRAALDGDT